MSRMSDVSVVSDVSDVPIVSGVFDVKLSQMSLSGLKGRSLYVKSKSTSVSQSVSQ